MSASVTLELPGRAFRRLEAQHVCQAQSVEEIVEELSRNTAILGSVGLLNVFTFFGFIWKKRISDRNDQPSANEGALELIFFDSQYKSYY